MRLIMQAINGHGKQLSSFLRAPFNAIYFNIGSALVCVFKVSIVDNKTNSAEGYNENWKNRRGYKYTYR